MYEGNEKKMRRERGFFVFCHVAYAWFMHMRAKKDTLRFILYNGEVCKLTGGRWCVSKRIGGGGEWRVK